MVSTRRTAQVEPAADVIEGVLLRKKPIRRPTAKKAETQQAPAPAPKTTRGRNATEEEIETAETIGSTLDEPQAKPVRRGPGRPKKEAQEAAPEEPILPPTKATRATKATVSKQKVMEVTSKTKHTEPTQAEPKATRRTRATAPKAQPLSPKKITQVSTSRTRNAKTAGQKPAIEKGITVKAPIKGGMATRKRTVSDENAVVPFQSPAKEVENLALVDSTPVKALSLRKSPAKQSAPSEDSMSSRATTPSQSPAPSFDQMEDANEYSRALEVDVGHEEEHDGDVVESPQQEMDMGDQDEVSEDELFGPKTPMKRASPGTEARYCASVQKSVRQTTESPLAQSPVQRLPVRRRVLATPRTVVPAQRTVLPHSSERATTVGRGGSRPETFRQDSACSSIEEQASPLQLQDEEQSCEDDVTELSEPQDAFDLQDNEGDQNVIGQQEVRTAESEEAPTLEQSANTAPEDPEETIIVDNEDEQTPSPSDVEPSESIDINDETVLVSRNADLDQSAIESGDDDLDIATAASHSPTLETIIWENIRQDLTIPLTFGSETLATLRAAKIAEDFASVDGSPMPTFSHDVFAGAPDDGLDDETVIMQSPTRGSSHTPFDTTVNINDFIDFGALAEATRVLDFAPQTDVEVEHLVEDASEGTASSEESAAESADGKVESVKDPAAEDVRAEDQVRETIDDSALEVSLVPHYAMPTIAFDARRKSLPAFMYRTPVKAGSRPHTSDGASIPRMRFAANWASPKPAQSARRESIVQSVPGTPRADSEEVEDDATSTPTTSKMHTASTAVTPVAATQERYPRMTPRANYEDHTKTAIQPSRFRTPTQQPARRPATTRKTSHDAITPRGSTLPPRVAPVAALPATPETASPEQHASLASETPLATPSERVPHTKSQLAKTALQPSRFRTPTQPPARRRAVTAKKAACEDLTPRHSTLRPRAMPALETPLMPEEASPVEDLPLAPVNSNTPQATLSERFPRLKPQPNYEVHAKTTTAPRFRTPARTPQTQPSTVQKHGSLRKVAFKNSTPMASHTPVKTPLKAAAMTPGQIPMTPHPAAPLRGVVALVEIFTLEGASASAPFVALLRRLGATATKAWSERVTHVIFKDGSPTTLQRVRLHNKEVEESGEGVRIHCVNSRWVSDCDAGGTHVDECNEAYVVDVEEVPRGGQRRRKSMEPSALVKIGGNIVRERKGSIGRSSLGRSPMKFESLEKLTPKVTIEATPSVDSDKENSGDEASSPATPAYLAAPDKLVQQTAPINRMRKLGAKTKDAAKMRRLTYFNGTA